MILDIRRYRKLPIPIDAVKYKGNWGDMCEWIGKDALYFPEQDRLVVHTLEGDMTVGIGDYMIRGVQGEFYPCKSDVFEQTYELIEGDDEHVQR